MPGLVQKLCSHGSTDRTPNLFTEPGPNHRGPHPDADPGSNPGSKPEPDFSPEHVARNVPPHCAPIVVAGHLGANHLGANHLRADGRTYIAADNHTDPKSNLGANTNADGAADNHANPRSNADVPWETGQSQYVQTLHRSELRGS